MVFITTKEKILIFIVSLSSVNFPVYIQIYQYTRGAMIIDYHLVQAYTSFLHGRMSGLTNL